MVFENSTENLVLPYINYKLYFTDSIEFNYNIKLRAPSLKDHKGIFLFQCVGDYSMET